MLTRAGNTTKSVEISTKDKKIVVRSNLSQNMNGRPRALCQGNISSAAQTT